MKSLCRRMNALETQYGPKDDPRVVVVKDGEDYDGIMSGAIEPRTIFYPGRQREVPESERRYRKGDTVIRIIRD